MLAALAAYAVVLSQPLFYMVVMTKAQRTLSAPAYIELRQRINPIMNRRVPVIYMGTLVALLVVLGLAFDVGERSVLATTTVALACLFADVVFAIRENQPINAVVDGWSPTAYPADWYDYREKWLTIFRAREVVLLTGYASLLVGAVFG